MPSREDIAEQIREFVWTEFPLARKQELGVDDALMESGAIDSMGVLEIVTFLESTFDIVLGDDEVASDTFDTMGSLATLVEQKLQIACRN
jgi:acyl carrier protein